jgi:hypothetical protein
MLRSLKDIQKYKIHAEKNDIGNADSFIFDPINWTITHLIVELNIPKIKKRVLIPTSDIFDADGKLKLIFIKLLIEEVIVCQDYVENKRMFYKEKENEKPVQLRTIFELMDYDVFSKNDKVGHISDLICDDNKWLIRYLVVDTGNWLPGRKVLVSPQWIGVIDWQEQKVTIELSMEQIKDSPEYDPNEPVNLEYEAVLYDYYGKPRYWEF